MHLKRIDLSKKISVSKLWSSSKGNSYFNPKRSFNKQSINSLSLGSFKDELREKRPKILGFSILLFGSALSGLAFKKCMSWSEEKLISHQLSELEIVKEFEELKRYNEDPEIAGYNKLPQYFSPKLKNRFAASSSLTQATYRAPDKIPFTPLVYYHEELKQSVEVCFVGRHLGDGNGNVHEGVISTLIDESFARVAFLQFRTQFMFTANLTITFKNPLPENSFFKIITRLNPAAEQKPYKAILESRVLDLSGNEIAEATSVFLVPKQHRATIGSITS